MSAHTPGPWRWSPEGLRAVADDQLILSRPWNVDPSTPDARLIAVAPDLYDELVKAADTFADFADALRLLHHDTAAQAADVAEQHIRAVLTRAAP